MPNSAGKEQIVAILRQPTEEGFQWVKLVKVDKDPDGFYLQPRVTYNPPGTILPLEPEKIPVRIEIYSGPHTLREPDENIVKGWPKYFQPNDSTGEGKKPR